MDKNKRISSTKGRPYIPSMQREAGMMGVGTGPKQGIATNVKPNLASGVRGTPSAPVGGRSTVGRSESLIGQGRQMLKKKKK